MRALTGDTIFDQMCGITDDDYYESESRTSGSYNDDNSWSDSFSSEGPQTRHPREIQVPIRTSFNAVGPPLVITVRSDDVSDLNGVDSLSDELAALKAYDTLKADEEISSVRIIGVASDLKISPPSSPMSRSWETPDSSRETNMESEQRDGPDPDDITISYGDESSFGTPARHSGSISLTKFFVVRGGNRSPEQSHEHIPAYEIWGSRLQSIKSRKSSMTTASLDDSYTSSTARLNKDIPDDPFKFVVLKKQDKPTVPRTPSRFIKNIQKVACFRNKAPNGSQTIPRHFNIYSSAPNAKIYLREKSSSCATSRTSDLSSTMQRSSKEPERRTYSSRRRLSSDFLKVAESPHMKKFIKTAPFYNGEISGSSPPRSNATSSPRKVTPPLETSRLRPPRMVELCRTSRSSIVHGNARSASRTSSRYTSPTQQRVPKKTRPGTAETLATSSTNPFQTSIDEIRELRPPRWQRSQSLLREETGNWDANRADAATSRLVRRPVSDRKHIKARLSPSRKVPARNLIYI